MGDTWQEALLLLHSRDWSGELVADACEALSVAYDEGTLKGASLEEVRSSQVSALLSEPVDDEEAEALLTLLALLAEGDEDETDLFRNALRDLDAFAERLGAD